MARPKKKNERRGKRLASADLPKFDAKKHVRLSDLAKRCGISYQSMYIKQKLHRVDAVATNYNGVEVIAFLKEDAKKIESSNPKPIRSDSVSFNDIEEELQISRPKLTGILLKLRISPVKRRIEDNRQVLTVTKSQYVKIKEALNS
jgi:hypothetical protein